MKSIDDALELRGRIFGAFELAELATDPAEIDRLLTFVVVGAGPTGVEMAGQIAELARRTLRGDFRSIDPRDDPGRAARRRARRCSATLRRAAVGQGRPAAAARSASRCSSAPRSSTSTPTGIEVEDADGTPQRIRVGLQDLGGRRRRLAAGPAARRADRRRASTAPAGSSAARPHPARPPRGLRGRRHGWPDQLPGVAQVAIQGGRYAAKTIKARLKGEPTPGRSATRTRAHGDGLAGSTRSPASAGSQLRRLPRLAALAGRAPVYIVGFKNRVTTLLHWAVSFLGRGRSRAGRRPSSRCWPGWRWSRSARTSSHSGPEALLPSRKSG